MRRELRGQLGALLQGLAHADDPAAADLHPHLADELQRLPALLPRVRGDDVAEVRTGRLEVVVVAVHAEVAQLLALLAREDPERAGDVDVDVLRDRHARPRAPAPSAARPGRAPPRRCRTRSRRSPPSLAPLPPSDGMSNRTARTGVSNRPDCAQKWQSSGQPPVLMETIPSISTSGPHQRMRTSWASSSASSTRSSGSWRTSSVCASSRPTPRSSTCSRAMSRIIRGSPWS